MTRQPTGNRAASVSTLVWKGLFILLFLSAFAEPAAALSELKRIPGQVSQDTRGSDTPGDNTAGDDEPAVLSPTDEAPLEIPLPDPFVNKNAATDGATEPDASQEPVEVLSDVSKIPPAVARMRELIVEAAASGDIERLRPLLGKGLSETQVGAAGTDEDPVAALKGLSGDPDGIEILAILLDVLSTGFVEVDKGTPEAIYVWPYFAAKPLASLSAPEKVDLFRLVTAGDFIEMQEFGSYNFYKVGITADGEWKFFVAGD